MGKQVDYIGNIMESDNFGEFEVLSYEGSKTHKVQFLNTGSIRVVRTSCMITGKFKDREAATIYGEGVVDSNTPLSYDTCINGKVRRIRCPYYSKWRGMLTRCYSTDWREKHPTYIPCTVCEEWKTLRNFRKWLVSIGCEENNRLGWESLHLDKDIIFGGNSLYSPNTCMLVHKTVNIFFKDSSKIRGDYALGVNLIKNTGKFAGGCSNPYGSDRLGTYSTELDAHQAWQLAKIVVANKRILEQTDSRVIKGLQRVIDKIQSDYDNNLITEDY